MNRKFLFVLIAASAGALALSGLGCEMCCNSSQGAGSIVITDPVTSRSHRATFNYRVTCAGSYSMESAERKVSGRIRYQDHGPWKSAGGALLNVNIEAAIDNVVSTDTVYFTATEDSYYNFLSIPSIPEALAGQGEVFCSTTYPNLALFKGTYTPRQQAGDGGTILVMVMDNGKGGPSADDKFEIALQGGVFDGYRQRGALAGGNIMAKPN